jgi:hypothetical protein
MAISRPPALCSRFPFHRSNRSTFPSCRLRAGLDKAKVDSVLKRLASFLLLGPDNRFAFFHKSVRDWLDTETVDAKYGGPVAQRFAIDVRVGRKALTDWAHQAFQMGGLKAPDYVLRHYIAHLKELGDTKQLPLPLVGHSHKCWLGVAIALCV